MAYCLLKLVTQETIITDAYNVSDLIGYLKDLPDGQKISTLPVSDLSKLILCIDPIKISTVVTNTGYAETSMGFYMPYSEDFIVPIYENQIVCMTQPSKLILDAYCGYVTEYKCKHQLREYLTEKMPPNDAEQFIQEFIAFNKKDAIEQ